MLYSHVQNMFWINRFIMSLEFLTNFKKFGSFVCPSVRAILSGPYLSKENHWKYLRHTKIVPDLVVSVNVFTIIKQNFLFVNQFIFPEFVLCIIIKPLLTKYTYSRVLSMFPRSQKDLRDTRVISLDIRNRSCTI